MSFNQFQLFPRQELKWRAKEALRGKWLPAVVITLLFMLFSTAGQYASLKAIDPNMTLSNFMGNTVSTDAIMRLQSQMTAPDIAVAGRIGIVALVIGILINGVFQMAASIWYLNLAQQNANTTLGDFFANFSYWLKGMLMYLWMSLWLMLWAFIAVIPMTLLIIVIGLSDVGVIAVGFTIALVILMVIKSAQYSLCFYALADNTDIGVRKALRSSIEATRGHVGDIVMTWISFLAWILFSSIFPPVNLYVQPYMSATFAGIWLHLRDEALRDNRMNPADFGLVAVNVNDRQAYDVNVSDDNAPYEIEVPPEEERIGSLPDASDEDVERLEKRINQEDRHE